MGTSPIFKRYLELKSIRILAAELNESDVVIRRGKPRTDGKYISAPFRAGNLRNILTNPIYIGKVRHKEKIYEGEHGGIIESEQFKEVQSQLKQKAPKRKSPTNSKDAHLLTGILFDETGDRLTPIHCNNHGKRYRYYVSKRLTTGESENGNPSEGWRIPATQLEPLVEKQLLDILRNKSQLFDWFGTAVKDTEFQQIAIAAGDKLDSWTKLGVENKRKTIQQLFLKITIKPGWISYELDRNHLFEWLMAKKLDEKNAKQSNSLETNIAIDQPMMIRRKGVENKMVLTNGTTPNTNRDPALIDMIVRANSYLESLTNGAASSLADVAEQHGTDGSEVSRLLPLAFLSPRLVEAVLSGNQPIELGARRLARMGKLPSAWNDQADLLGFNA